MTRGAEAALFGHTFQSGLYLLNMQNQNEKHIAQQVLSIIIWQWALLAENFPLNESAHNIDILLKALQYNTRAGMYGVQYLYCFMG